jgi:hypothetical protein
MRDLFHHPLSFVFLPVNGRKTRHLYWNPNCVATSTVRIPRFLDLENMFHLPEWFLECTSTTHFGGYPPFFRFYLMLIGLYEFIFIEDNVYLFYQ